MISIHVNSIVILNINGGDYYCILNGISKLVPLNLLKNADLTEKKRGMIKIKKI